MHGWRGSIGLCFGRRSAVSSSMPSAGLTSSTSPRQPPRTSCDCCNRVITRRVPTGAAGFRSTRPACVTKSAPRWYSWTPCWTRPPRSWKAVDGATDVRFLDAVVTHHTDGFRSGVARFNELLALHLQVPLLSLRDPLASITCPLLSFKVSELGAAEAGDLERLLAAPPWSWEIYLHEYAGLELEQRLVGGAQRVHCGNAQIRAAVDDLNSDVDELWAPGLIVDDRVFPSVDISVFSFGMAHKIRTDMF